MKTTLKVPIKVSSKPKFDPKRRQSWSQLSCFSNPDYPKYSNPEKWYQSYILGKWEDPTPQLLFGGITDKRIQNDPDFLPELERFPEAQHELDIIYSGIELYGLADGYDSANLRLKDDKTGVSPWTQGRADKTGQLTMYCLILYLRDGIKPEKVKCQIDWLPTVQNADLSIDFVKPIKIHTFYTKRTMVDLLKFITYIKKTVKAMEKYANNHK